MDVLKKNALLFRFNLLSIFEYLLLQLLLFLRLHLCPMVLRFSILIKMQFLLASMFFSLHKHVPLVLDHGLSLFLSSLDLCFLLKPFVQTCHLSIFVLFVHRLHSQPVPAFELVPPLLDSHLLLSLFPQVLLSLFFYLFYPHVFFCSGLLDPLLLQHLLFKPCFLLASCHFLSPLSNCSLLLLVFLLLEHLVLLLLQFLLLALASHFFVETCFFVKLQLEVLFILGFDLVHLYFILYELFNLFPLFLFDLLYGFHLLVKH